MLLGVIISDMFEEGFIPRDCSGMVISAFITRGTAFPNVSKSVSVYNKSLMYAFIRKQSSN